MTRLFELDVNDEYITREELRVGVGGGVECRICLLMYRGISDMCHSIM